MKVVIIILLLVVPGFFCNSQPPAEEVIGNTWYDVQTSRSMQNRIYFFEDETIGAVFNWGMNFPSFTDLGVGYNYFNGNVWNQWPTEPMTSAISKNPSYTKFGVNGEIVVSEGENGLYINYRMTKGEGDWEQFIFQGPAGYEKLYSPQIVTTGNSNEIIHLLALRKDTTIQFEDANQHNTGQVLYSKSSDYGNTWDIFHHEFDFNLDYFGFSELSIVLAEPKNNTLSFLVGDYYTDLILMKSMDGGENWQKNIVWEHPFPFFEHEVTLADTFWANTGSQSIALDNNNEVHLVFALCQIISDTIGWTGHYNKRADGIAYWREDMPIFPGSINSLNPDSLFPTGNLVGWFAYGNPNIIYFNCFWSNCVPFYPSLGISTMPSISISGYNEIFITFCPTMDTYDNGSQYYKHLIARSSYDGGNTWNDFYDLTGDLIHIFDECVFPVVAPVFNNDYIHLLYQRDNEPGLAEENIGTPIYSENFISYMKIENNNPNFILIDFYAYEDTIHEGESVQFYNFTSGNPSPINYEWYFEGGSPSTSNNEHPNITYYSQGIFDVKLIASNDLYIDSVIMEDYITVLPETGIEMPYKSNQIYIYPNPTEGEITISSKMLHNCDIKIYDLKGNVIIESQTPCNIHNIDLSGNPEGIYLIEINTGNKKFIEKVVLKN